MRRVLLDVVFNGSLVDLGPVSDDVGARQFVAGSVGVRHANDGCIGNERMREEECFEFRGRNLEAFVFDEFLR